MAILASQLPLSWKSQWIEGGVPGGLSPAQAFHSDACVFGASSSASPVFCEFGWSHRLCSCRVAFGSRHSAQISQGCRFGGIQLRPANMLLPKRSECLQSKISGGQDEIPADGRDHAAACEMATTGSYDLSSIPGCQVGEAILSDEEFNEREQGNENDQGEGNSLYRTINGACKPRMSVDLEVKGDVVHAGAGVPVPRENCVLKREDDNCHHALPSKGKYKLEIQNEELQGIGIFDLHDSDLYRESSQGKSVGKYEREMDVAVKAVQLACILSQSVQERLQHNEEKVKAKQDKSFVTVADWGVQAVVSWVLSQAFGGEEVSLIAEEDTRGLRGMDSVHLLQGVVNAVNDCLSGASLVGIRPPDRPLGSVDVLKAINKGTAVGVETGRYWVLDPVDGTLGFVRGDQYAVALAMVNEGDVVLAVLGCPNYPLRKQWLDYHHRYYRLMTKLSPPHPELWHKGLVMTATKGGGQPLMQPLLVNGNGLHQRDSLGYESQLVTVSVVDDPANATFCEPVEKANSSHSYTRGLAHSLGLRNRPLRVYSMAKYAAIARGDAEIFMKFAKSGYKEKIWDHAAGVLIVQEAGGIVTDAGGRPLDFSKGRYLEDLDRGIVASSGIKLHEKILRAVDASWEASTL